MKDELWKHGLQVCTKAWRSIGRGYLFLFSAPLRICARLFQSVFAENGLNHSNKLVIVEVLLPYAGKITQSTTDELKSSLGTLQCKFQIGCIAYGVSDNPNGTAGLDIAYKCINLVPYKTARVLSIRSTDYLGRDIDKEPDAITGVHQCIIATSCPTSWVKESFELRDINKYKETIKAKSYIMEKWIINLFVAILIASLMSALAYTKSNGSLLY